MLASPQVLLTVVFTEHTRWVTARTQHVGSDVVVIVAVDVSVALRDRLTKRLTSFTSATDHLEFLQIDLALTYPVSVVVLKRQKHCSPSGGMVLAASKSQPTSELR